MRDLNRPRGAMLSDRYLLDFLIAWMTSEGYRAVGTDAGDTLNRLSLSRIVLGNGQIARLGRFLEVEGREACPELLTPGEKRSNLALPADEIGLP